MGNIIIAEDSQVWQNRFKSILESVGHNVQVYRGKTNRLINILKGSGFDLFITDIKLDALNLDLNEGLLLAEIVRETHEFLPIIAVSAFKDPINVRDAFFKFRVVDFVFKHPWDKHHFLGLVENALSHSQQAVSYDDLVNHLPEEVRGFLDAYSEEIKDSLRTIAKRIKDNQVQTESFFSEIMGSFQSLHERERIIEAYFATLTQKDDIMRSKLLFSLSIIPGILKIQKVVDLDATGQRLKEYYDDASLTALEKLSSIYYKVLKQGR